MSVNDMAKMAAKEADEAFNSGEILAYESVKEEMQKIEAELKIKGISKPVGFSVLEQFIQDRMNDCIN